MPHPCLEFSESYESEDPKEEEYDELGSESGSFLMCGTCLGGLLGDIEFAVGVMLVGNDWPFNSGGVSFFHNVVCVL